MKNDSEFIEFVLQMIKTIDKINFRIGLSLR